MNKNLLIYSSIFLLAIPIFGLNFLLHFIGNILLLIFLVPLLILSIILVSFSSLKSQFNICEQCGNISFGKGETCVNCGADLNIKNPNSFENYKKPGETTIEVKAEEVK